MSTSLSTSATQMLNLHYAILGSQPTLTQLNAYAGTYKKAQTAGATADGALDAVATVILDSDAAINALMPNLAAPKTLATKLLANVGITNAAIVDFIAGFLDGTSNGGKPFPLSTAAVVISNYVASYKTGTSAYTAWDADLVAAQKVHSARAVPEPTGQTFTLTTGTDMVMSGATNDTINAPLTGTVTLLETFSSIDQIDGGAGTDSLYVEVADNGVGTNAALNLTLVKGVEKVSVFNRDTNGADVTMPADKMVSSLTNSNSANPITFGTTAGPLTNGATTLDMNGVTGGITTLTYSTTALAGASDALSIALNGSSAASVAIAGQNLVSNVLETVAIRTSADSTLTLDLGASNLTSGITLSGAGKTTLTVSNASTSLKTVDASAATGAVVLNAIANPTSLAITGGSGSDTLNGGDSNDVILGGAGNDSINGGAGNDSIDGGAGNDTVVIAATSGVSNLTKDDTIVGGDGVDTIRFATSLTHSTTSTAVQPGTRISGFETLAAGASVSVDMTGLAGGNTITTAVAAAGDLTVTKDTTIATVNFTDTVARTVSIASAGAQTVGLGSSTSAAAATGTLSTAATSLTVNGVNKLPASLTNTLTLGPDSAGVANATVTSVTLTGASRVSFDTTGTAITKVDASAVTAAAGTGAYSVNVNVGASKGAVTYVPPAGSLTSSVTTGEGADVIPLGDGADNVSSGAGADTITAGAGNDTIDSGAGNDFVTAGEGDDTLTDSAGDSYLDGGAGNDNITGGTGNDQLYGGDGNDSLTGGAGADTLSGGAGTDTISDGAGNDSILGGDGADTITAGEGSDYIDAGAGNDLISSANTLGSGDTVTGGDGVDTLKITGLSGTARPTITSIEALTLTFGASSAASTFGVKNVTDGSVKTVTVDASGAAASVTLGDLINGSTVNIADDSRTFTGTGTAGDISLVTVDMADNSSAAVTINVNGSTNDAAGIVATTFTGTTVTDAGAVTINSSGGVTGARITNTLGSLSLNSDVTSLTIKANDFSGLNTGNLVGAGVATVSLTAGAGSTLTTGTYVAPSALASLTATAAGTGSKVDFGGIGDPTTKAVLTSASFTATGGATIDGNSILSDATALTTLSMSATDRGSTVTFNGDFITVKSIGTSATFTANAGTTVNPGTIQVDGATDDTTYDGTVKAIAVTVGADATFGAMTVSSGAIDKVTYTVDSFATSVGTQTYTGAIGELIVSMGGTSPYSFNASASGDLTNAGATNYILTNGLAAATKGTLTFGGSGAVTIDLSDIDPSGTTTPSTGAWGLTGGSGADNISGGSGADTITGNRGNDTISGGAGNDSISSGDGNDSITGGAGADTINAGSGSDTIVFSAITDSTNGTTSIVLGTTLLSATTDVIQGLGAGDVIQLPSVISVTASTSAVALSTAVLAAGGTTALTTTAADAIALIRGSYSSTTGIFTAGTASTDDDYLLQARDQVGATGDVVMSAVLVDIAGVVTYTNTANAITLLVS